jgi:hypothetical protein
MAQEILDGKGTGTRAKVNANNELYTRSMTISEDWQATKIGNSYNINTGIIDLTDAAETPIIYIKNNEETDLHIITGVLGAWTSTGGTGTDGVPKLVYVKNPTAGTIISSPTNVDINSNRNYGSSNTLSVDAYKGATGDTMTDGTDHIILQIGTSGRTAISIDEVLSPGTSFGIKYTPQGSNTSQKLYFAVICHLIDPNT